VEDGKISVTTSEEVDKAMTSNPRTAIGMIDDLHYVMVVADGRTSESAGLSLYELAEFMQSELGVTLAYNLDGGGSSTMYFNGEVINNPTTNGTTIQERSVSDIVYIQ
jgi:exopolysaccharide biosynthesis protein